MKRNWRRRIPLIILIATAGLFAFSGAVMLLWNGILPAIIHVGAITFWQAMGILVLSKLLFSGFRGRRHFGHHHWRAHMWNKWHNMTPEQRAEFKGKMCGHWQMRGNTESQATAI
ncbi:MAG TPA: hypothetical protein VN721_10675 [Flavipsychrobacter sp.]|nr:hypothetical protein [Flavipsychrobacter sp.]